MKNIPMIKKLKVIKLFFSGFSYDEIAIEVGVSKGSVVNVIDDFKAGELTIAPNEYIDALRELAVDIRKQHVTVKQLKVYQKIHQKLSEMGVGMEQVEEWLGISRDIATESVSAKKFVAAALHLAKLEMETGNDPESLVAEFKAKSDVLNALKAEIVKTTNLKNKATAELGSINKATTTAKQQYQTQTKELKTNLDDFIVQNKLSWNRVSTVAAILEGGLAKTELGEKEVGEVTKLIAETGSLVAYIKSLKEERKALNEHILELKKDTREYELANIGSKKIFNELAPQVLALQEARKELTILPASVIKDHTSEQEILGMTEQSRDVVDTDADTSEHSKHLQVGSYYGSAETERARMEINKKFLESLSGP